MLFEGLYCMQCVCVTRLILKIKDKISSKWSFAFSFSLFGLYLNSPSFVHWNRIRLQLILINKVNWVNYMHTNSYLVCWWVCLQGLVIFFFYLFMVSRSVPEQRFYHLFVLFRRSQGWKMAHCGSSTHFLSYIANLCYHQIDLNILK